MGLEGGLHGVSISVYGHSGTHTIIAILSLSVSSLLLPQEEFSSDETVQFKSYLLSMGISDPVTRRNCATNQAYFQRLATQISDFLKDILSKVGGIMSSTDAFCRINRARGMELLSPEDLIEAGTVMQQSRCAVIMKIFDSGVVVRASRMIIIMFLLLWLCACCG